MKNHKRAEILGLDSKFANIVLSAVESEDCFIQNLKELETVSGFRCYVSIATFQLECLSLLS